jgi:general secretion pathway protein D
VQGDRWAVQVASFARDADAERLRYRLQQLGYTGYVGGASTAEGERWRVYAGPVAGRDAAERLRDAIAGSLHIGGMVVTRQ